MCRRARRRLRPGGTARRAGPLVRACGLAEREHAAARLERRRTSFASSGVTPTASASTITASGGVAHPEHHRRLHVELREGLGGALDRGAMAAAGPEVRLGGVEDRALGDRRRRERRAPRDGELPCEPAHLRHLHARHAGRLDARQIDAAARGHRGEARVGAGRRGERASRRRASAERPRSSLERPRRACGGRRREDRGVRVAGGAELRGADGVELDDDVAELARGGAGGVARARA